MDVVFRVLRDVVIDHMRYAADIDPPGGDVGRYKNPEFPLLESFEGFLPLGLCPVRVDGGGRYPRPLEASADLIGSVFCPGEDEHALHLLCLHRVHEQVDLGSLRCVVEVLDDGLRGIAAFPHLDGLRIAQDVRRKCLDVRRDCRGKEHCLPL